MSPCEASGESDDSWIDYQAGASGLEPLVEIQLIGPRGRQLVDAALVDTGADFCAFPRAWLPRLGMTEAACAEHPGALDTAAGAGTLLTADGTLELVVHGQRIEVGANFSSTGVALLGRNDVLTRFLVTFDQRGERFRMEPYDS